MREFTIDFTKALTRGLVAFPGNEPKILMLTECHNQILSETGLRPYAPFRGIGWEGGGFFHYLPIRDQNGVMWYWYPVFDGHILTGNTIPSEPTTGLEARPLVDEDVSWVEILDENNSPWLLYPDPALGWTRATDTTPLTGNGVTNLVWKGTTTEWWTIRFNSVALTRHAVKV